MQDEMIDKAKVRAMGLSKMLLCALLVPAVLVIPQFRDSTVNDEWREWKLAMRLLSYEVWFGSRVSATMAREFYNEEFGHDQDRY